jgi:hypothetical protein
MAVNWGCLSAQAGQVIEKAGLVGFDTDQGVARLGRTREGSF